LESRNQNWKSTENQFIQNGHIRDVPIIPKKIPQMKLQKDFLNKKILTISSMNSGVEKLFYIYQSN